ncbi:carbohydrate sulfotransferase 13-like isoform X1 [Hemitrygon akajei]|uniref:carbohydrate sulfotransferase 13-like isoform X1 n=2 Tax=Hemitrygon akajei TaxID=2704970 RepID=UPI003BF9B141
MTRSRGQAARLVVVYLGPFLLLLTVYLHSGFSPAFDRLIVAQMGSGKKRAALTDWSFHLSKLPGLDPQQQRIQQRRRAELERACAAHGRPSSPLSAADLRHLIVDNRHRLLYCYVPKVASTNWKRVMQVLAGQAAEPLDIPASQAHSPGRLPTLDTYPPAGINQRLRHYLKFLFVREPFERLVSAYRSKFAHARAHAFHRRYGTRIVRRHRQRPSARARTSGADVTFAEFAWYLADPRTRVRDGPFNEHWETVHALCHPCQLRYDVLGRHETLAADARYLLALAGHEHPVAFPAPAPGSKGTTTLGMTAAYFRNLSAFYRRKLYRIYRLDYELFNYTVPTYLDSD